MLAKRLIIEKLILFQLAAKAIFLIFILFILKHKNN